MTESPDVLTVGHWENTRGGVWRWVPDAPELHDLIACPRCLAKMTEPCRLPSGGPCVPHRSRLVGAVCQCGQPLAPKCRLCDSCRASARRASWRAYKERLRVNLNAELSTGSVDRALALVRNDSDNEARPITRSNGRRPLTQLDLTEKGA